ncbi:MAG: hypothetical protein ABUK19_02820 [Desulfobacteria bacterium]
MEQAHVQEVEEVMYEIGLPKDFKYYKPGVGFTCKAKDVGMESYIVCLEEHPLECKFSVGFFGDRFYCECPLRVYVAKMLEK